MSEAVLSTQITIAPLFSDIAISGAYQQLRRQIQDTYAAIKETTAKHGIKSLLNEVYEEYNEMDWNGYGAQPIKREACVEAWKLLQMLPSSLPLPEIMPERDGSIALEWTEGPHATFVINVSGNNVINYAGIFGTNRINGSAYFDDFLPQMIIDSIFRLAE